MIRTEEFTEHEGYRFSNVTNIEDIGCEMNNCYDALLRMDDKVIFAPMTYSGDYVAAIYELIETPEETGLCDIECRLNLIEVSEEEFKDAGHAVAWALTRI